MRRKVQPQIILIQNKPLPSAEQQPRAGMQRAGDGPPMLCTGSRDERLPSTCTAAVPQHSKGKGMGPCPGCTPHSMDPALRLISQEIPFPVTGAIPICAPRSCPQDSAGVNLAAQAQEEMGETDSKE